MTAANKKRFRRGDPLVYKDHVRNGNIICYTLDGKTLYKPDKEAITNQKAEKFKKYYLKAVRKLRKENPNITYNDSRIWHCMVKLEFDNHLKGRVKNEE